MPFLQSKSKPLSFLLGMFMASIVGYALAAYFLPSQTHAASLARACTYTGNCGFCDIVATVVTVGKWLITAAAGSALIVIVWASISMITSAGNAEKTGEAKKQIAAAIIGMLITFFAFNLISLVVSFITIPAANQTFEGYKTNVAAQGTSLGRLLNGVAWWDICNEKQLIKKGGEPLTDTPGDKGSAFSTADCIYWGDGTPCSYVKGGYGGFCHKGKCVKPTETTSTPTTPIKNPITNQDIAPKNACEYLAALDPIYAGYACRDKTTNECNPINTDASLCPQETSTGLTCCAAFGTPAAGEIPQTGAQQPGGVSAPSVSTGEEASVRAQLEAGGVRFNRTNACANILTSTECTSVAGLSQSTIQKLIAAQRICNNNTPGCITITGGTERGGHSAGTSHGWPNVVDVHNSSAARGALKDIGLMESEDKSGFRKPNTYVCDTKGVAVSCGSSSHLHITF